MTVARPTAPPAVRWVVRTLEEAGHETWTVGGAVRDAILGHPSGDWDFTTRARPAQVRRVFRRTVPIGIEHGTVGVLARDGTLYEVTTFRKDVRTDGRHAVVEFADHVEDDLARRDFTINAIAWHPLRDELLDPYGGVDDLDRAVLRTVGEPERRFEEDYLRILRALRFASRFGLDVDDATWTALCGAVHHLPSLSAERIREELLKVLDADERPSTALGLYVASGALAVLYPELDARTAAPDWPVTLASVDHLPRGRPLLRLTALLHGLARGQAAQLLVRLRLSNAQADAVAQRVEGGDMPGPEVPDADVRRWLSRLGPAHVPAVARVSLARARVAPDGAPEAVVRAWRRVRGVLADRPPLTVGDLAFDGGDLIRMGLRPGPAFKGILSRLLAFVLEDPLRNHPDVLRAEAERIVGSGSGGRRG